MASLFALKLDYTQQGTLNLNHKLFSIILQISPTRCTILLNIFISLLYMFRAFMCPSSGENYCIYVTLVFVTLYGWRLVTNTSVT